MSTEPTPAEALLPRNEHDPKKNMNNFYLKFPASKEVVGDFGDNRRLIGILGKEDQIIGEDYPNEQDRKDHSRLWLNQTYREFHAALDQAAIGVGLPIEEIQKMRDALAREKDYYKRAELKQKLDEKLEPVGERLLKEGYKPYDLSI